jgi:hypothetical protein
MVASPPTGRCERKGQDNALSKGFRSAVQNFSDSEEWVPHSFAILDVRATAVGTGGGAGRKVYAFLRRPKHKSNESSIEKYGRVVPTML